MDQYAALREIPFDIVMHGMGVPFVDFKMRKNGAEWYGPCPCCQPKRNKGNFSYHVDGKFRCFSCPAKGRGSLDLCMQVRGIGFQQAVEFLKEAAHEVEAGRKAKRLALPGPVQNRVQSDAEETGAHRETPQENPPGENKPFAGTYEKFFRPSPWLEARGLTQDTLRHYESGFYENPARRSVYNGSVMLKMRRWSDGECVGYLARNIGEVSPERPKYSLPRGLAKSLELFGAWQLKDQERGLLRTCFLLESPFAVMAFHQKGFAAVSAYGFSVSAQQVDIMAQIARGWIYVPDRDKANQIAPFVHLITKKAWCKTPDLPEDINDPESLSREAIQALLK